MASPQDHGGTGCAAIPAGAWAGTGNERRLGAQRPRLAHYGASEGGVEAIHQGAGGIGFGLRTRARHAILKAGDAFVKILAAVYQGAGGEGEAADHRGIGGRGVRSEEHTSELQSLRRTSYADF